MFVTGATGFVGSAVVPELLSNGHFVLGLSRTEEGQAKLKALGADSVLGTIADLDVLKKASAECDAVIHLAFIHDFANYADACEKDRNAITAIADALAGSNKVFLITSGTLGLPTNGGKATEKYFSDPKTALPRVLSELLVVDLAKNGIRTGVVRLPPTVHGDNDKGFVPMIISAARKLGSAPYVGDGSARWTAVHKLDAAKLYRLAIEKCEAGGQVFHAVQDEEISGKEIAEVIGQRLNLATKSVEAGDAVAAMGFVGMALQRDSPTSGAVTREKLGWEPKEVGLLEDLKTSDWYFRG